MDRLDGMKAFVSVAESGSFSVAAARLGVARALVSKRIAMLEGGLGVRLLNRTTRRVSLTGPGTEFLARAQRILADFADATGALADLQAVPTGRLKLSAGVSFSLRHLGCSVARFMQAQPRLVVELVLNDRFLDPVEEGFDLCVRVGELSDSSLVARRLTTVRRVICAAPGYLAEAGMPTTPADLAPHRGLHYAHIAPSTRWTLLGPDGPRSIELPMAFCANNGDVLLDAAIHGQGVVNLPTFIAGDALRDGRLVPLLPSWQQPPLSLAAMWPPSRYMPAKLRVFVDFLVREFTDPPAWDDGLDGLFST